MWWQKQVPNKKLVRTIPVPKGQMRQWAILVWSLWNSGWLKRFLTQSHFSLLFEFCVKFTVDHQLQCVLRKIHVSLLVSSIFTDHVLVHFNSRIIIFGLVWRLNKSDINSRNSSSRCYFSSCVRRQWRLSTVLSSLELSSWLLTFRCLWSWTHLHPRRSEWQYFRIWPDVSFEMDKFSPLGSLSQHRSLSHTHTHLDCVVRWPQLGVM